MTVTAPQTDSSCAGPQPEDGARPGSQVMALSRDPALLEVLQDVVPNDSLVFLSNEAELARRLLEGRAGVVVLDTESIGDGAAELAHRLHAQLPDLALIAAGTTQDEPELAPLVAAGTIHRFLHKPVSAQRVKLFIDAAWRRHESSVSGTWPVLAQPAAAETTGTPKGLLPGIAAGLAAMVAGVVWFSVRLGEHRPEAAQHVPLARPPAQQAVARIPVPLEQPAAIPMDAPRPHPLPKPVSLPRLNLQSPPDLPAVSYAVVIDLPAAVSPPANTAAPAPTTTATATAADNPQQHKAISALLLNKTYFVDPEYPLAARGHDDNGGRVDLEYTVRADGSVSDVVVTHAEPVGVYEAAAVKAVRQWRYDPILRDGHPVDQRVYLELRFAYRDPATHP